MFPKGKSDRIRSWGKAVDPGESCRKKADTPYPVRAACPDSSSGRCRKGSFCIIPFLKDNRSMITDANTKRTVGYRMVAFRFPLTFYGN